MRKEEKEGRCKIMIPPVPYRGEEPYIFISYAHKDANRVWPIVARLQMDGYRVWYDEGIDPGTEWDENIASHVRECGYFLAFLSESYLQSDNCKDELNYARDLEKKQVLIYLEDVHLPAGIALRFGRFQNFRADRPGFFGRLYEAEGIKAFTTGKKIRSKKWILPAVLGIAVVIAAALVLPGMLPKEEPPQPETQPEVTEPAQTEPTEDPFTLKKSTFLSESGVKLTSQGFRFSEEGDLILDIATENSQGMEIRALISDCYMNGINCFPSQDLVIQPGNHSCEIKWEKDDMERVGLVDLAETDIRIIEGIIRMSEIRSEPIHFVYYPYGQANATYETYEPKESDVILVDNEDCQVIMTNCFYDETGDWVGDFVSINRTDRLMSIFVSLDETNGYQYGFWWEVDVRPGCALRNRVWLDDWQHTQQDEVQQINGVVSLSDPQTHDMFGMTEFTLCPGGGEPQEFPARQLAAEDIILVDNAYAYVAVISAEPYNKGMFAYTIYCQNLSDKQFSVELNHLTVNGTDEGNWGLVTLKPGEQGYRVFHAYHDLEVTDLTITCDVTATYDSLEMFQESVRMDFSW